MAFAASMIKFSSAALSEVTADKKSITPKTRGILLGCHTVIKCMPIIVYL